MDITQYSSKIRHMDPGSHKGQNGKVMVIGGSELFHAASAWALDVVSAMVDMVFYSSVPENNELIHEAKKNFWSGVVIPRGEVENYIDEADVVLIGPGMTRDSETTEITNRLLTKYPHKKWVVDAGALQMVDASLLHYPMIITPHQKELDSLRKKMEGGTSITQELWATSQNLRDTVILLKGQTDMVVSDETVEEISGGNPGMTKGGTGDALAGLVAGLYVFTNDPFVAAVVGSYVNKKAGDELYKTVGPFFTTNQLVEQIPKTLKAVLGY